MFRSHQLRKTTKYFAEGRADPGAASPAPEAPAAAVQKRRKTTAAAFDGAGRRVYVVRS